MHTVRMFRSRGTKAAYRTLHRASPVRLAAVLGAVLSALPVVVLGVVLGMALVAAPGAARAAEAAAAEAAANDAHVPVMRLSVENVGDHIQVATAKRFARVVNQRAEGLVRVTVVEGAGLYRGADVVDALALGRVEMGIPGTWHISKRVPDVGVLLLPMFYGRGADQLHAVVDGPLGTNLADQIHKRAGTHVLGRWIDLGFAHLFGVGQPVTSPTDITGRIVRVAGGRANAARVEVLGATAISVPWPDLPIYLREGRVGGVLTSYASITSANLWRLGVTSCWEDRQYFPMYVPLVSQSFWYGLSPRARQILAEAWEEQVAWAREQAALRQRSAKAEFIAAGCAVHMPGEQVRRIERARLLQAQDSIRAQSGISPTITRQAAAILKAMDGEGAR